MSWLWGGMQYQLEHHLFPIMPRYYYWALAERVQKFARDWQLDYRTDGVWQIWVRTLRTIQYYAVTEAVPPGSPVHATRMPYASTGRLSDAPASPRAAS